MRYRIAERQSNFLFVKFWSKLARVKISHIPVFLLLIVFLASTLLSTVATIVSTERAARAVGSYDNATLANKALEYKDEWGGEACRDAGKLDANGVTVGGYGAGQCRTFANCIIWMVSGGTQYPTGTYFDSLDAIGDEITSLDNLKKGDIVQSGNGVHTYFIVSRVSGSTFWVVDSNSDGDDTEMVRHHQRSVTLDANNRAFRLGKVSEASDPPENVNDGGGVGSATYRGDRLNSGDVLYAGQYIASPNLRTALVLRANGDLVLYGPNTSTGKGYSVRWSKNTSGSDRLVMQGDGNLVVYKGSTPKWWSGTGAAGSYAIMQNDGNFAVRNPAGSSQWATGTGGGTTFTYAGSDRLNSGEQLDSNEYIRSADGRYVLLMKSGGTLVLYSAGYHVVWYKAKPSANRLVMQGDGNLVMYEGSTAKWSSGSTGSNTRGIMQGDGNFVIYNGSDAVWNTKTSGKI